MATDRAQGQTIPIKPADHTSIISYSCNRIQSKINIRDLGLIMYKNLESTNFDTLALIVITHYAI